MELRYQCPTELISNIISLKGLFLPRKRLFLFWKDAILSRTEALYQLVCNVSKTTFSTQFLDQNYADLLLIRKVK